jgi:hypothetical protein
LDTLWANRTQARQWGEAGRELYASLKITWPNVVQELLKP